MILEKYIKTVEKDNKRHQAEYKKRIGTHNPKKKNKKNNSLVS